MISESFPYPTVPGNLFRTTCIAGLLLVFLSFQFSFAQSKLIQTGVASYYGKAFHGKKTACGEKFNMWAMTAAHRTLPFHTKAKVTNLSNGKSVVVRINDVGPFKKGRILDLSRGAAAKLNMIKVGKTKVRIEVIDQPEPSDEYLKVSTARSRLTGFGIQVGSFTDINNLLRQLQLLRSKGVVDVYVQMASVKGRKVQRIIVGGFSTRASAADYLKKLRKKGISGFVFTIR